MRRGVGLFCVVTAAVLLMAASAQAGIGPNYITGRIDKPIPDDGKVVSKIHVKTPFVVTSNNGGPFAFLRITHPRDSDLKITLRSPMGTKVLLVNQAGGDGADFGGPGAKDCSYPFTGLYDGASTLISDGTAPFVGFYKPVEPISVLRGEDEFGVWKLIVRDVRNHKKGEINCWGLGLY